MRMDDPTSRLLQAMAPGSSLTHDQQQIVLQGMADALPAHVTLFSAGHTAIASAAPTSASQDPTMGASTTMPGASATNEWSVRLADGRSLGIGSARPAGHSMTAVTLTFLLLALAVGAAAYPIMRRLARRLERLQQGVEALGAGDLSVRVAVEGEDEVGQLALVSTRPPNASKTWWVRTRPCSPTRRTSCARHWRASAWPPS